MCRRIRSLMTASIGVRLGQRRDSSTHAGRRWLQRVFGQVSRPGWSAVAIGFAVGIVQLHHAMSNFISPYDEGYHLSYVEYLAHGEVPHLGDALGSWSRKAFSCHPVFPFGQVTAVPCGDQGPPSAYPEGGTNTAAGWPPVYYAFAASVARFLTLFGVEPLYGARIASVALWAAGAAVLVLVARRFGSHPAAAAAAGLIAGCIPAANTLGAFVTPHSAQLLLSVIICATALSIMRADLENGLSARITVAGLAVPLIAVLVVPHAVFAVAIAYCALAVHWAGRLIQRQRIPFRAWILLSAPALATGAYYAWNFVVNERQTAYASGVDAGQEMNLVDPRGDSIIQALVAQWWHFFPSSVSGDSLGFGNWELLVSMAAVTLVVAAVGAALLTEAPPSLTRPLAVGVLVASPVVALGFERTFAFTVPLRYGSSIIGIGFLLVALGTARAPARWLFGFSALLWVTSLFTQWP